MASKVESFLRQGQYRLRDWLALHGRAVVFPASQNADILFNINTPHDLAQAERVFTHREILNARALQVPSENLYSERASD